MKKSIWIETRQAKNIIIRQIFFQTLKKMGEIKLFKIIPKNSYWFILDISHTQFRDLKRYLDEKKINLVLWNNQKKKAFIYLPKNFTKQILKNNHPKSHKSFNFIDSELSFIDGFSKYQINENLNLLTLMVDENCFGNFSSFRIFFNEIFKSVFFQKKKFQILFLAFKKLYKPYLGTKKNLKSNYFFLFFFFIVTRINNFFEK